MDFDRETKTLQATRDFSHGALSVAKGDKLSDEQLAGVDDASVSHLVEIADVAKVVSKGSASADSDKGGKSTTTDKP